MSYRLATHADDYAVLQAFEDLELASPQYRFSQRPSARAGFDYYWEHKRQGNAYIVDEHYLLLVNDGKAWHGADTCLEEGLVLALKPNGNLGKVVQALEAVAKERKVTAILVHDSSLNFRMSTLYERAGFIPITRTHYKALNYGTMDR